MVKSTSPGKVPPVVRLGFFTRGRDMQKLFVYEGDGFTLYWHVLYSDSGYLKSNRAFRRIYFEARSILKRRWT